jgi:hypothetical protein
MKRFLSNLVLFMLVKVFEENVYWVVVYLFFGLIILTYEKGPFGVFFKYFSNSLNMKNPRVFFLWTHKKTLKGPYGTEPLLPRVH